MFWGMPLWRIFLKTYNLYLKTYNLYLKTYNLYLKTNLPLSTVSKSFHKWHYDVLIDYFFWKYSEASMQQRGRNIW